MVTVAHDEIGMQEVKLDHEEQKPLFYSSQLADSLHMCVETYLAYTCDTQTNQTLEKYRLQVAKLYLYKFGICLGRQEEMSNLDTRSGH